MKTHLLILTLATAVLFCGRAVAQNQADTLTSEYATYSFDPASGTATLVRIDTAYLDKYASRIIDSTINPRISWVTDLVIPPTVTDIHGNSFQVTSIGDSAFLGWMHLASVKLPEAVASIGKNAFRNCFSLSSINLPDSMTEIGEQAFYQCFNIQSIDIPPALKTLGARAFYSCTGLSRVTFPGKGNLTTIPEQAFYRCAHLGEVAIPSYVSRIDNAAFKCTSLGAIYLYGVSTPPLTIGEEAFRTGDDASGGTIHNVYTTYPDAPQCAANAFLAQKSTNAVLHILPGLTDSQQAAYRNNPGWSEFNGLIITGVEDIVADGTDVEPEYFTVSGVRVREPVPGLYIVRRGTRVSKELVR